MEGKKPIPTYKWKRGDLSTSELAEKKKQVSECGFDPTESNLKKELEDIVLQHITPETRGSKRLKFKEYTNMPVFELDYVTTELEYGKKTIYNCWYSVPFYLYQGFVTKEPKAPCTKFGLHCDHSQELKTNADTKAAQAIQTVMRLYPNNVIEKINNSSYKINKHATIEVIVGNALLQDGCVVGQAQGGQCGSDLTAAYGADLTDEIGKYEEAHESPIELGSAVFCLDKGNLPKATTLIVSQQTDPNLQIGVASLLNIFDLACALEESTVSIPLLESLPADGGANTEQMAYWSVEFAHSLIKPQTLTTIRLCMPNENDCNAVLSKIDQMMNSRK